MKPNRLFLTLLISLIMLSFSACNVPTSGNSGTSEIKSPADDNASVEQAAGTIVAQTLTAGAPTLTDTPQPPLESFTPTLTSTVTLSPTSKTVTLVITKDTYCRQGAPSSAFKSVVIIKSGQQVEVISRSPENDSYYVKNPYEDNSTCWIYGKGLTLSGNAEELSIATLEPTPTPTRTPTPNVGFTVTYDSLISCAPSYAFRLYIKNTGAIPWNFISITGSDSVTGFAINHTSNVFDQYSGCSVVNPQDVLTAGDDTYAMNLSPGEFNYNPAGHLINLNVKLCTLDNAQGSCTSKTISFTP